MVSLCLGSGQKTVLESQYSDILGDYTGATEGETAGTLDEWED